MPKSLKTLLATLLIVAIVVSFAACSTTVTPKLKVTVNGQADVYFDDSLDTVKQYLTVKYTDNQGVTSTVTDYELEGTLVEGECALTVKYASLTATCAINVKSYQPRLDVTVSSEADVRVSDSLNFVRQYLTVTYTDSNNITITVLDYELEGTLVEGNSTLTVRYTSFTANCVINVKSDTQQDNDTPAVKPKVVFNANGGVFAENATVNDDCTIVKPASNPTRQDYTFVGWYKDTDCSLEWNFVFDRATSDTTLYAKWKKSAVTEGLEYALNTDGESYCVMGMGTATDTEINIPLTHDGKPVTTIMHRAFENCSSIVSVTISDNITWIGSQAFGNCSNLATVYWNATECVKAGAFFYEAFDDCFGLTTVVIGDNVTVIPEYAFMHCQSLRSITIPNSVTTISNQAFADCSELTRVTLGANVESIDRIAFSSCYRLIEVFNLSSLDLQRGSEDNGCLAYYAKNVCTATNGKSKLKLFDDSYLVYSNDGNSSLVGYIGKQAELTLPAEFDGRTYDVYQYAFRRNLNLTSVTFSDGVTSVSSGAFAICVNLQSVTFSDSVKTIGREAFGGCSKLTSVAIPYGVVTIGSSAFDGCSKLTNLVIPNSVTTIGSCAFYNCDSLTSVVIPDSVKTIGGSAFDGCSNVTSVAIGKGVTSIEGGAFYRCNGLTEISVPEGVRFVGSSAFGKCGSLEKVYWNALRCESDCESLSGSVFYECSNLTTVVFGENITTIPDGMLCGCVGLKSITIPDSVTSIGRFAFYDCRGLTNLILGNGVETIGGYAFARCYGLKDITIPGSVKSMGILAFGESNIANVVIEDGVTSIGDSVFYYCMSIESIVIPQTVTVIDEDAFYNADFEKLFYKGTEAEWKRIENNNIVHSWHYEENCYFYSETRPIIAGNYWHYVNGVPTIW